MIQATFFLQKCRHSLSVGQCEIGLEHPTGKGEDMVCVKGD